MRTHRALNERSLALHRLIAEKIRRNPVLFAQTKKTLAHWRITVYAASQPYLEEWARLIDQGLDASCRCCRSVSTS